MAPDPQAPGPDDPTSELSGHSPERRSQPRAEIPGGISVTGVLSEDGLDRVRSEAASAEQRAAFLAALALLGLSDSIRTAFYISRQLRQNGAETITLGIGLGAIMIAAVAFFMCGISGTATLLDKGHLRLVRAAMIGSLSRARERIGERALDEAARRGLGETTKVLEAKLVTGLRCTGWFLLGGSAWIIAKIFAA